MKLIDYADDPPSYKPIPVKGKFVFRRDLWRLVEIGWSCTIIRGKWFASKE